MTAHRLMIRQSGFQVLVYMRAAVGDDGVAT